VSCGQTHGSGGRCPGWRAWFLSQLSTRGRAGTLGRPARRPARHARGVLRFRVIAIRPSHPPACFEKPVVTAGVRWRRAWCPTHPPRAGGPGIWVTSVGVLMWLGASPVTSERWACRPLGWPTGSRMVDRPVDRRAGGGSDGIAGDLRAGHVRAGAIRLVDRPPAGNSGAAACSGGASLSDMVWGYRLLKSTYRFGRHRPIVGYGRIQDHPRWLERLRGRGRLRGPLSVSAWICHGA
jgi:hypothetical protein